MNAALLVVTWLAAQAGLEGVREALAAGEYHSAWEALGTESDELARSRGRAEILYRAGDPAGALRAACAGLGIDPAQIDLLYHATGASVWLEDGPGAVAYSGRLLRAADTMEQSPEERRAWQEAARKLVARSEALVTRENELSRALARLRFISTGGVGFWLFALWLVLRSQGRSSKPVS